MVLETLALSIKRLQHRNYRTLDAKLAPLGISLVQWSALREIEQNPGLSMHRLAELTFNSAQAFGTLITRLLRQGLVERQSGAGRVNLHRLTPRGKALLAEGHRRVRRMLTKTFAPLDARDLARFQGLLDKVLGPGHADPDCSVASPGLVPKPGRPIVRAGGSRLKGKSPRAVRTR